MDKISVVIPIYNGWELCHQLLWDIYNHNNDVDEVLLMNNAAEKTEPQVITGAEWWKKNMLPQLRMIDNEENLGFLKNCNKGVSKAKGNIIILVSTDVRIEENMTTMIRSTFKSSPKLILGGIYYQGSTGWNEFKNGRGKKIFPYLEGWLLIFTKQAWEDAGGFDERYAPNDFEDVDLSTTWLSKGYTLAPLSYSSVRHLGAKTLGYTPERQALTERNREKFADKWGVKIP